MVTFVAEVTELVEVCETDDDLASCLISVLIERGYTAKIREALAKKFLERLSDMMFEDLMEMSDEEIMEEALAVYGSQEAVDAEVERVRKILRDVMERKGIKVDG